jgi:hypothetical protein
MGFFSMAGVRFYLKALSMPIVGRHPESGVRIAVERERDEGPPWRYTGEVATPEATFALTAQIDASGDARVELADVGGSAPHALAERVRLILRAAHKHARDIDPNAAPPRRIVRWRER